MSETYKMSWMEVYERVRKLPEGKCFGIPRGGTFVAAMTGNAVDTFEAADYLVDDIIDSGKTAKVWKEQTGKEIYTLVNKDEGLGWVEFPWERSVQELPAEDNIKRLLQSLGENTEREGLQMTPKRYVKFLREFLSPSDFNFTVFNAEKTDEMIVQSGIPFFSLCEHHLAPFFGTAVVAYIPNGKIAGLSKLARTVDKFSRRLQNQERIATNIADYIEEQLEPLGVAVLLRARHLCMEMRGVEKQGAESTTSCLRGLFKTDHKCREEFLHLAVPGCRS
jgi:GTP cyclohydrolase I